MTNENNAADGSWNMGPTDIVVVRLHSQTSCLFKASAITWNKEAQYVVQGILIAIHFCLGFRPHF